MVSKPKGNKMSFYAVICFLGFILSWIKAEIAWNNNQFYESGHWFSCQASWDNWDQFDQWNSCAENSVYNGKEISFEK